MATEQQPPEADSREPRRHRRDFSVLLWLCGWGGAAAVALSALAIASQTKTATERLRQIFTINEPAAVAQMPPRVAQLESAMKALADQIRVLNADRDRLSGRIALLENSIDDMTGAIKRQAAATAAVMAAKTAPPTPTAPATTPPALPANLFAPPAIPAVTPAAPARVENVTPALPATTAAAPAAVKSESSTATTDAPTTEPVPLPPVRLAAAPPVDSAPRASAQNEYGLDLGGAPTLDGVRQRWLTVKTNFAPLLSGMHPVAGRDPRPSATGYRLVVGPLPNSAAASGLCAHFTAARTACRVAKFDGEQIAQH